MRDCLGQRAHGGWRGDGECRPPLHADPPRRATRKPQYGVCVFTCRPVGSPGRSRVQPWGLGHRDQAISGASTNCDVAWWKKMARVSPVKRCCQIVQARRLAPKDLREPPCGVRASPCGVRAYPCGFRVSPQGLGNKYPEIIKAQKCRGRAHICEKYTEMHAKSNVMGEWWAGRTAVSQAVKGSRCRTANACSKAVAPYASWEALGADQT
jgi:hypothetical protein